jgi:hypothetical protein
MMWRNLNAKQAVILALHKICEGYKVRREIREGKYFHAERNRGGWRGRSFKKRGRRCTVYAIENSTARDNMAAFRRFTEECYDGAFKQKLEDAINSTEGNEFDDVVLKTEPGE